MPGISGIDATRRILADRPEIGVLMLTMYDEDETVFAALRAGARGYLLKGAEQDEIVRAVTGVARGEAIFGPPSPPGSSPTSPTSQRRRAPVPELTERELEVLGLVASGRNNTAIARVLGVSTKTVANHVSNTLTKLQFADRAEAIIRARDAGLGTTPPGRST